MRQPTFVSLYSGCGGLDLGFLQAGFRNILSCDNDRDAEEVHKANLSVPFLRADLSAIPEQVFNAVRSADTLVAGPPCQGFSTAGKNDAEDSRNQHLLRVLEVAQVAQPSFVVIENVRGLLGPRYQKYWTGLVQGFASAGYQVKAATFNATDFGAAQTRKRVILFASRIGELPRLVPTHRTTALTLRDVLAGVENCSDHRPKLLEVDSEPYRIARLIDPGQKLSNVRRGAKYVHTWHVPDVFGHVTAAEKAVLEAVQRLRRQARTRDFGDADPVKLVRISEFVGGDVSTEISALLAKRYLKKNDDMIDLTHTFNGKFRRLAWDESAPTVDTRFGQPRYFLHPGQNRGFSVREAARIQGFPDNFLFSDKASASFRLIGNAVPPPFARAIADAVASTLRDQLA